jgi:hypothetical protein
VSPNPLHRNPSYRPIRNPDLSLREGEFGYIVWDAYSASRSPRFEARLLDYVRRFEGTLVTEVTAGGRPVVRIYELLPGANPSPEAVPAPPPIRGGAILIIYGLAISLLLALGVGAVMSGRIVSVRPLAPAT